jgi:hypothetical protein
MVSPEVVPTKKERRVKVEGCPTAWAGTEVDSVSKNVLENLSKSTKAPQNAGKPGTRI